MRRYLVLIALLLSGSLSAQQLPSSYGDIVDILRLRRGVGSVRSMNDGEHYTYRIGDRLMRGAYLTGEEDTLCTFGIQGVTNYQLSPDERMMLVEIGRRNIYRRSYTADWVVRDLTTGQEVWLPREENKMLATFSPDSRRVAFVRENNLYLMDLPEGRVTQVTSDGVKNRIINGATDWVYEEEFAFTKAYAFSPDGSKIAYLRFDESQVPEYTIQRFDGNLYPRPYTYKYPKAGQVNSIVELHVYDIATGQTTKVDVGPETDQYLSRIGWTPSGELWFYRSNRRQNCFEVLLADEEGRSRVVYSETSPRYIDRVDDQTVTFLSDGDRFIVKNETHTGYMHLYLYSLKKGFLHPITSGEWEVTELVGVEGDRVWYLSTETSPLRRNLYSVKLNGRDKRRLTEGEGTYSIVPSKGMHYYVSNFSNASTPSVTALYSGKGELIRVMEENKPLEEYIEKIGLPEKKFFTFTTERGTELNGYVMLPAGFDSLKRYPVLMTQYSGPGSQSVADSWSIGWEQALLAHGYAVVCIDGRGTGFRGEEFKKCTYGDLGRLETEDQISGARYLASLPWVDPDRIGIYGWSYGGFMALNSVLKGNDVFKMAIAVAPVTSWRYYDTIYTEVYNDLPQENPRGYDENSPIHFADLLRGKLLLIHGSADDNVHVQNSYEMARALVAAGKQFDMMIYPDCDHSMVPSGTYSIREKMIDYTLKNL